MFSAASMLRDKLKSWPFKKKRENAKKVFSSNQTFFSIVAGHKKKLCIGLGFKKVEKMPNSTNTIRILLLGKEM